ncbi:dolichol-phosphate mannosyltransferase [Kineococcus xinjiangensis]|uniref:Dolichol-phosphate mannosyltransferase n=1 Tax=Kineococcus xinjiangensis TaxID=512762 RepID=A0A2S6IFW1_9ACTN|nr:polyprenol monophosphomannose synthase [Kineococcus xinjiangensis]PPK93105.1 dolichol-phosphate mannosyltransferase [Kineococcus xinjiangensis]
MRTIVVLPTYQEAENIAGIIAAVLASPVAPDVLVVDDSSPDGTGDVVRGVAAGLPEGRVRLLTRPVKEGLGAAYRSGFAQAVALGYDAVVQMDADGSHPVSALVPMAAALAGGADLVLGSRYVPGGAVDDAWPWYRRLLSRGGNVYARVLLRSDITDLTGGFKMWRASLLARLDLDSLTAAGYAFQIQTTLAALELGARTAQVPILFTERTRGSSKMSRSIVAEAMVAVVRMRRHGAKLR